MKEDEWRECELCRRKWKLKSLEFDYCPDCFANLKRYSYLGVEVVKLEMMLKYSEFQDPNMLEVVKLLYSQIKKRAYEEMD